jgi:hypothetical protein
VSNLEGRALTLGPASARKLDDIEKALERIPEAWIVRIQDRVTHLEQWQREVNSEVFDQSPPVLTPPVVNLCGDLQQRFANAISVLRELPGPLRHMAAECACTIEEVEA